MSTITPEASHLLGVVRSHLLSDDWGPVFDDVTAAATWDDLALDTTEVIDAAVLAAVEEGWTPPDPMPALREGEEFSTVAFPVRHDPATGKYLPAEGGGGGHHARTTSPSPHVVGEYEGPGTGYASKREHAQSVRKARQKTRNAPMPTEEEVVKGLRAAQKAREEGKRAGGERPGSNLARRKENLALFEEWKEPGKNYVVCPGCGKKMKSWSKAPGKLEGLTKDKIVTGKAGGDYRPANLMPLCKRCNQSHNQRGVEAFGHVKWGNPLQRAKRIARRSRIPYGKDFANRGYATGGFVPAGTITLVGESVFPVRHDPATGKYLPAGAGGGGGGHHLDEAYDAPPVEVNKNGWDDLETEWPIRPEVVNAAWVWSDDNSSMLIQNHLRNGAPLEDVRMARHPDDWPGAKTALKILRGAMTESDSDAVAYRGVALTPDQVPTEGDVMRDKGIVSFTPNPVQAREFAQGRTGSGPWADRMTRYGPKGSQDWVLETMIPAGHKGLILDSDWEAITDGARFEIDVVDHDTRTIEATLA
jgi:hypothetical protein